LIGGAGNDTVSFEWETFGIYLDLGNNVASGSRGAESISGFENAIGSNLTDAMTGSEEANQLEGRDGGDYLYGLGGDDVLLGEGGDDVLTGGEGADTLEGGAGNDNLGAGAGDDVLDGGDGDDMLTGAAGNDTLDGGASDDLMDGGEGEDLLLGGEGDDTLEGWDGNDTLDGGAGSNLIMGGDGLDQVDYSTGEAASIRFGTYSGLVDRYDADGFNIGADTLTGIETLVATSGSGDAIDAAVEGTRSFVIDLNAGTLVATGSGGVELSMTVTGFEQAEGGALDDAI
ncbi:calcium-binding protein, partial [Falsiroseomonas sp.]|uniref:calcium-binding protein n=1 Tax=Falsiroseomonas sp. TaxID=2870721 RepID=UPI003F71DEA7